jgi:dTDP-4-amino-4,6-dideoxygalactose transaminase
MTGITKIPFFGIDRQYASLRKEILDVTDSVYSSGQVLDNVWTAAFEDNVAKLCERKYAVAVNSGTQALIFALRALDAIEEKDRPLNKILIPSQSYIATVNSVLEAGFDPVFCDVDPVSGLIDLNKIPIESNDISAVMYVNLFGNVIDQRKLIVYLEMFAKNKIPVIEDAAQSFGARYQDVPSGKLGDISILSFDPTKNLNNYGSGGMILTDVEEVYKCCLALRDNGKLLHHTMSGTNSRMGEADCAQMLVKLDHFPIWQERRTKIANYYTEELNGLIGIIPVADEVTHSWSKYVIHHFERSRLYSDLEAQGVETRIHYTTPLHLHNVSFLSNFTNSTGYLEGAETFSKTCLSLPIYPELTDLEVEYVVDAVKQNIW